MTAGGPSNPEPFSSDIDRLPEPHREALRLRHVDGWPLDRIAAQLGISNLAVARLLLEAAGIMQSQLDDTIKRDPR